MSGPTVLQDRRLDLLVYLGCAVFAGSTAVWSEFYGYRVWGNFAVAAYLLAAAHAVWLLLRPDRDTMTCSGARARWTPIALIGTLGMTLPLSVLVFRRLTGVDWLITPSSWAAQPEVWVIERSATTLLRTGTPYLDVTALGRPPVVNDYTPYGPAMSLFGLPRAIFGGAPAGDAFTDARLVFALVTIATVALALRLLGRPRIPVRAAQLAVVNPFTALTCAVAGPDLPIIGLVTLAAALLVRAKAGDGGLCWAAGLLAATVSMKLTALPAVVVLGVLVAATLGSRAVLRFAITFLAVFAGLNVPVFFVSPGAFVEHVIDFPMGLGEIDSPAGSALPGHLIASTGPAGQLVSLGMLGFATLALTVWLVIRPPRLGSDALFRIAIGLGVAILLMPASRWGYLVYPFTLLGATLCFSVAERTTRSATDPLLVSR